MPTIELTGEVVEITSRPTKTDSIKVTVIDQTTDPKYPEALAVSWVGKSAVHAVGVNEGDVIKVKCRVKSHKWEESWFNDINGYACEVMAAAGQPDLAPADKPGEYGTDDAIHF